MIDSGDVQECENCGCILIYDSDRQEERCPHCVLCESCGSVLDRFEESKGTNECFNCYSERHD